MRNAEIEMETEQEREKQGKGEGERAREKRKAAETHEIWLKRRTDRQTDRQTEWEMDTKKDQRHLAKDRRHDRTGTDLSIHTKMYNDCYMNHFSGFRRRHLILSSLEIRTLNELTEHSQYLSKLSAYICWVIFVFIKRIMSVILHLYLGKSSVLRVATPSYVMVVCGEKKPRVNGLKQKTSVLLLSSKVLWIGERKKSWRTCYFKFSNLPVWFMLL